MSRSTAKREICAVHGDSSSVKATVTRHATRASSQTEPVSRNDPSKGRPRSSTAAVATVSDSTKSNQAYEEYIHNLQQQVYYLELETQMLKHTPATAAPTVESFDDANLATTSSFDDIFTQFKRRNAATEKAYTEQIDNQKRVIESLRAQLDAHGGLVLQLRHEMTRQADLHAVQCQAWSQQHEEALIQLRGAEGRIAALESDGQRNAASFEEHVQTSSQKLESAEATIVSLRARAHAAEEAQSVTAKTIVALEAKLKEADIRNGTLQRTIDDVTAQLDPLRESSAKLVAERDAAVLALKTCEFTKRTLEASVMKLEQEAAQLLKTISEQQSSLEGLQSELRRAENSQELARMSREDSDAKLVTALSELATAKQARSHAEEQARLALSRAEELAGELTRAQSQIARLDTGLAIATRDSDAIRQEFRDCQHQLGEAAGRSEACSLELEHAVAKIDALNEQLQAEMQARIAAESELAMTRRIIEGKPDIKPLETIDFNSLIQTNIDAASTVDAFLKDAKEREAALASDLENIEHCIGEERPAATATTRAHFSTASSRSATVSSAKPRTVLPMTESPGRTLLPASEARAKLLGHAKFIPFDATTPSTAAYGPQLQVGRKYFGGGMQPYSHSPGSKPDGTPNTGALAAQTHQSVDTSSIVAGGPAIPLEISNEAAFQPIEVPTATTASSAQSMSFSALFWLFLQFGLHAWGGPVAQIAMLKDELVVRRQWITPARFNRVLAVYQVLPGPEATELCCYFGMVARGRVGAVVAGLGFVLPGFVFMLALSALYEQYGIANVHVDACFSGLKPVVVAIVVRATHRLSEHAFQVVDASTNAHSWDVTLLMLGWISAVWWALRVNFFLILIFCGVILTLFRAGSKTKAWIFIISCFVLYIIVVASTGMPDGVFVGTGQFVSAKPGGIFVTGLIAGLITFGGAYTTIPFLREAAVIVGAWMTEQQFIDGLGIVQVLPTPLVMITTFIGYLGSGVLGGFLMALGVFIPAFSFTLIGHNFFERVLDHPGLIVFLDGVTASVVGLIVVVTITLLPASLPNPVSVVFFCAALVFLYTVKHKFGNVLLVLSGALAGELAFGGSS